MSEQRPEAGLSGDGSEQGVAMTINVQYVKDLSFENPRGVMAFVARETPPGVDVGIRVQARSLEEAGQGQGHEVTLEIRCQASDDKGVLFLLELHYAGVFTLQGLTDPSSLAPVLLVECPRLLFPFARALVADMTRDSGFAPVVLGPVNFMALYEQHLKENAGAQDA